MDLKSVLLEIKRIVGKDQIYGVRFSENYICISLYEVEVPLLVKYNSVTLNTASMDRDIHINLEMMDEIREVMSLVEDHMYTFNEFNAR